MDTMLLASIIQGEAGGLGPVGMMIVALSLSCRINQHGHSEARIAREWYGRAEPGEVAKLLAQLVVDNKLPPNDAYFVMGHGCDVEAQHMKRGELVLMDHDGKMGLHVYGIKNVPWLPEEVHETE